ncbi:V-type proton ATPase subunit E [Candidatus Protochlamydia amoebophila]|uniref:V-type ATP synthase subunit E n=1 Tax=Candidatus Protochlamydia amoebophila TaxID=362787 RepID=UPI001BC9F447|nr:V-type ATP synthase subunit E [Candidatus Protochlamydia amoebophila]MBS4163579.1 V-type proton ATPase subunit E [Candidatus Protochlamydia amoebophila]
MKSLEQGQEKIQRICDKIRHQTIEPAQEEARKIIEAAHLRAKEIISNAEQYAEQYIKQAKGQIEQERNVFHSSLQQASKQTIESLKQEIEYHLFNEELQSVLEKQLSDPKLIAELINGIVKAIDRDGLNTDLTAVIPRAVSADDVSALLLDGVRKKLKRKPLEIGQFAGGAQIKLHGKKMTVDLSDQTIKELLANYVRKDFRQLIFSQ